MDEKNSSTFKPYIPADKNIPELTVVSIIVGVIMTIIFSAANAYLGLRVGMTVSASIPAAVLSMGIIRMILRRDSILENNMVQTIGSAGESLAAGTIFTLPVVFMWAKETTEITAPGVGVIMLIALCGGILGVVFMIPLRTALIVEEHGTLPFPEGTACAEVLIAGETGGDNSRVVFMGLGFSALFKFIADGICLFPSEIHWEIQLKHLNTGFGADVLPALTGVGFICGRKIAAVMLAGGVLGWFVLIPLINIFGIESTIAPAAAAIADLDSFGIWSSYLRYIGAGAVVTGGIISLIKSIPLIVRTFSGAMRGSGHKEKTTVRTNQDISSRWLLIGVIAVVLMICLIPDIPIGVGGALLVVVFGFFFATVSSRMVGLVGASNNPVSGMAIATLLISTLIIKAAGNTGYGGMVSAITIGTMVCIITTMAGDTSQDLKTGYIVGATPAKQQIGELIGTVVAAATIGGVMYLMDTAWGFGSAQIPAPQASLMKVVVEGVMGGNLPWGLVFIGVAVTIMIEILEIPALPFAIGLYLPIHLTVPIFIGGVIREVVERKNNPDAVNRGVLFSSGLIAGEGLVGILLAVFAIIHVSDGRSLGEMMDLGAPLGNIGGIVFMVLIIVMISKVSLGKKKA